MFKFYTWRLCQLPIYFFWTSNPSFFDLLCETVAGPWKHFFFASGAMLRHWRDTTKEVTDFPRSRCFVLPAPAASGWCAGQSWALTCRWIAVVHQRVVSQNIIVAPWNAAFQWLSPAPSLAVSCLPAPSCSTLANFSTICHLFSPNEVWVSTLVGVGEQLPNVLLLWVLGLIPRGGG